MTRYDAILLVFAILFALLAGYFGYREWTDPILFPGGAEQQSESAAPAPMPSPSAAPQPDLPEKADDDIPPPEPDTAAASFDDIPVVDAEAFQASVEETLTQQVGQLAAIMETRLADSLESAQEQVSGQSEKLAAASETIQEVLSTYQDDTRLSVDGLSETMGLIGEMQDESETITSGLENARSAWDQLFEDVTAIDARSDDRLNEENFEFKTYAVGSAETVSQISNRLEADYDLPESDLSFLLNRFNDIEYRLYDPGGRRAAYRVVANESLRVPVPKTAGTILEDYAFPEKLRSQITYINQASSANASLRSNLTRQVGKLKQLEAGVQAMASMTEALAQIDLNPGDPLPDDMNLSPELQEAWKEFENALSDFRSASGFELEQLARERLQRAISRLLGNYEESFLESTDTESDPLEYYLRFIERYRPRASSN